jgi:hypothetical protein
VGAYAKAMVVGHTSKQGGATGGKKKRIRNNGELRLIQVSILRLFSSSIIDCSHS